jgi:acyl-[acyl-carrier-protein] desaturase
MAAQRIGVYTSMDYVDLIKNLLTDWDIENVRNLQENGEKARDFLMNLPIRLARIAERAKPSDEVFKFSWIRA